MGINTCPECLKKQRRIDALEDEIVRLKSKLRYQERKAQEGFFRSSTPSSPIPVKPNTKGNSQRKPKGARLRQKGGGWRYFHETEADRVVEVSGELPEWCPNCGDTLVGKGAVKGKVLESRPVKAERGLYVLHKRHFRRKPLGCFQRFLPQPNHC